MKRVLLFFLTIVMVLSMVVGCTGTSTSVSSASKTSASSATQTSQPSQTTATKKEPIYLAFICPLTGNSGQYGQAYKNACTMLLEKVNKEGGINGSELIIDWFDDKNDPNESLLLAQKVVAAKKYPAVLGSQSSACSMVIAPVFQAAKLVELSPQTSHINFTNTGDYIFRMLVTVGQIAPSLVDFVMGEYPNTRKPAILYVQNDFGKGMYTNVEKRFDQYGITLMNETFIQDTTKDFTPMLSKFKAAGCDLFIPIGAYADVAQILIQKEQLGFTAKVQCEAMIANQAFADIAGSAGNGLQVLEFQYRENKTEPFATFMKDYEARYGRQIDLYATAAYDSLLLMVLAMRKYGPVTEKIKEFLAKEVKDIPGTTGKITIDENRVRQIAFQVLKYTDKKFAFVREFKSDVNAIPKKVT